MNQCLIVLLVLQIFIKESDQRPIIHSNKEGAVYARAVFTRLLRDVVFRDMIVEHLETAAVTDRKQHMEPQTVHFHHNEQIEDNGIAASAVVLNDKFEKDKAVEVNLAVSSEWLSMHKKIFLDELQRQIGTKKIKCEISSIHMLSDLNVMAELFCYYLPLTNSRILYVPSYKLRKLLDSDIMKKFLEKYNSTTAIAKLQDDQSASVSVASFIRKQWVPLTLVIVGSVLAIVIMVLIVCCCRRNKGIQEGEKIKEKSFEKINAVEMIRKDLLKQSNVTPMSNNTYDISPKRTLFLYSPNKMSTPIFSFTSPTKFKDKLVYPTSPIETTGPQPIQPQVELLYPSTLASTPTMRKLSGNSTTSAGSCSDKSRTLLQSRRGSSASLVIDVSPQNLSLDLSVSMHESPSEEILMRKSRPLRFREFRRAQANDKELHEEFWGIPPNTVGRKDTAMKHSLKNRYPDILPNSRSIVRLKGDDQKERYINANFIRRYDGYPNQYIATQGPLTKTMKDFWQMVWQFNVPAVVMITKLKEKNKEKCCQYWPSPDTVRQETYGNITVTYDSHIERDGYQITTFYVSCKGSDETRQITHYWFTSWPDHKVPKSSGQVVSLAQEVSEAHMMKGKPIVVHCSAGRGRTGCFIAITTGISQIAEDNCVDILKIVSQMRIDRGGMVDKDHQYRFIYSALFEYWYKKHQLVSPTFSRHSIEEAEEEMESFDDDDNEEITLPPEYKRFSFGE